MLKSSNSQTVRHTLNVEPVVHIYASAPLNITSFAIERKEITAFCVRLRVAACNGGHGSGAAQAWT